MGARFTAQDHASASAALYGAGKISAASQLDDETRSQGLTIKTNTGFTIFLEDVARGVDPSIPPHALTQGNAAHDDDPGVLSPDVCLRLSGALSVDGAELRTAIQAALPESAAGDESAVDEAVRNFLPFAEVFRNAASHGGLVVD